AIEDSFSSAHADRNADFKITHLLSWTLIDWPSTFAHGRASFPAATHHAISDRRDTEYLQADALAPGGQPCRAFKHPYAMPEACLTARAKAAAAAVVDLLVFVYRARTDASGGPRAASLFSSDDTRAAWRAFLDDHVASVATRPELPDAPGSPLPRA